MTEIRFYHLTRLPLEDALPVMLECTVERKDHWGETWCKFGSRAELAGVFRKNPRNKVVQTFLDLFFRPGQAPYDDAVRVSFLRR